MAQALGGGFWAKVMALSIALSVIATTGTGIVLSARIAYGMASYRALPGFLGNVSRRYKTPAVASVVVGVLLIAVFWVYMLATSVQNAFYDVIDVTGLLFAIFYILTALATIVYYRRRVFGGVWDFIILGVLPLGAAGFLGWMFVKSVQAQRPASRNWSLIGIVALGLVLMFIARVVPALAVLPDSARERHRRGGSPQQARPLAFQARTRLRVRPAYSADLVTARRRRALLPRTSTAAGIPAGTRTARTADWSARSAATSPGRRPRSRPRGSAPTRAAADARAPVGGRHEGQHVVGDGRRADQRRDPLRAPAVAQRSARRSASSSARLARSRARAAASIASYLVPQRRGRARPLDDTAEVRVDT